MAIQRYPLPEYSVATGKTDAMDHKSLGPLSWQCFCLFDRMLVGNKIYKTIFNKRRI